MLMLKDRGLCITKQEIGHFLEKDVKISKVDIDEFLSMVPIR